MGFLGRARLPLRKGRFQRVCFLLNNEFTLDNRVEREARSLLEAGYEVTLFCSHGPTVAKVENRHGIPVHRILPKRLHTFKPFSFRIVKALISILTQFPRYDVVHAHDCNMLLLGWLLSRAWGARLVYDSHELWGALFEEKKLLLHQEGAMDPPQNLGRSIRNIERMERMERWLIRQCDAVISVNQTLCTQLDQLRGGGGHTRPIVPVRNTAVLYPPVPRERPRRFHELFGLSADYKVVLLQGGLREDRGIYQMTEALQKIKDPKVVLVMMGPFVSPGFEKNLFEYLLQTPGLQGRVFHKAPVYGPELLTWTASADLGVAPILNSHNSYYHSLPNKLFEYIQAEVPSATSDFPEMKAIVEGYEVGFTFDPDDADALAQKIEDYFADSERMDQYRQNNRRAKQELNWENEQGKLLALYDQL